LADRGHQRPREHVERLVHEARSRGAGDDDDVPARELRLVEAHDLSDAAPEAVAHDRVADLTADGHAEPHVRERAGVDEDREVARRRAGPAAVYAIERAPAAEATGRRERERGRSHARRVHFL
jgi:hypothetical protein